MVSSTRRRLGALHARLGTAGFALACVALLLALTGAAYAASGGLSGKQKKEVKAIAKSFQGTGPAGPVGTTGTNGTNGKDGANGQDGTNGKGAETATFAGSKGSCTEGGIEVKSASPAVNVCNGVKGTNGTNGTNGTDGTNGTNGTNGTDGETGFTEILPSEKTEKGSWSVTLSLFKDEEEEEEFSAGYGGLPFNIPLAGELESSHVVLVKIGQEGEVGKCSNGAEKGKASNPLASPGFLCVYMGFGLSAETFTRVIRNPGNGSPGAAKSGAVLQVLGPATAAGLGGYGTYAVTAPSL